MALLLAGGWFVIRQAQGQRHRTVIAVLLLPALVLGWFEYEDRRAVQLMSHVASVLAHRPVSVNCQRYSGALVDMGSELGSVQFDENGDPSDVTDLKYDACTNLRAWLGSNKQSPTLDQVIAVHVLAHESEHLAGVISEVLAECNSVQTTERTALLLGATAAQARSLAEEYATDVYPRMPDGYRSTDCRPGGSLDRHPDDPAWP